MMSLLIVSIRTGIFFYGSGGYEYETIRISFIGPAALSFRSSAFRFCVFPGNDRSRRYRWVLISAALVFLMTPGLGFFYGGMVRNKNVLATIMQSFFIVA